MPNLINYVLLCIKKTLPTCSARAIQFVLIKLPKGTGPNPNVPRTVTITAT